MGRKLEALDTLFSVHQTICPSLMVGCTIPTQKFQQSQFETISSIANLYKSHKMLPKWKKKIVWVLNYT